MRSKSAGGLKVKALGQTPRDLGLSPSWCSNFSCSKFASRENYLLIQDISREIPTYPYPIYRHPPKSTEIPLQEIPKKLRHVDTDINMDFKKILLIRKLSYQKYIKDHIGHISRNHPELDSLINTGKVVKNLIKEG